jgi:Flp pilus assembly protein TadG
MNGPVTASAPARRLPGGGRPAAGQSLAEFAIAVPLFLILMTGIFEFSFAFNATLNTNYASRAGGSAAAAAGNSPGADCLILDAIDQSIAAPTDRARISRVEIQRTNANGAAQGTASAYQRSGSTTCSFSNGTTMSVPYSAVASGYPVSQRCNVVAPYGCPTLTPPRTTVDNVSVQVTYVYPWHTPLRHVLTLVGGGQAGTGFTITQRNVFRMEPVL